MKVKCLCGKKFDVNRYDPKCFTAYFGRQWLGNGAWCPKCGTFKMVTKEQFDEHEAKEGKE